MLTLFSGNIPVLKPEGLSTLTEYYFEFRQQNINMVMYREASSSM